MQLKKLLESFNQFLEESVTDVVFHGTEFSTLLVVLKNNKFTTSVAKGISSDERDNKGRIYYFSTARSITSTYLTGLGSRAVLLKLDGRKLSQRYKSTPVDYYNKFDKSTGGYDEMEDRIVTDKPSIDNALSYILEIHCLAKYAETTEQAQDYYKVQSIANKNNIPIYFYTDSDSFYLLNKKKALSAENAVKFIAQKQGEPKEKEKDAYWDSLSFDSTDAKDLVNILKAIEVGNKDLISSDNHWKRFILSYPRDFNSHLPIMIQNDRKSPKNRKYIDDILHYMKSKKLSTFDDFREYLKVELEKLYTET